ncbi:MAG: hypothetical protein L0G63_01915 [Psychrobacter sp.]|jgi:hypothetical protein|uniref:hypothetical protein n=1 Tax=Psychrobacter sp. TaxID=56811 RepID=UPI0026485E29|nr:hypothetical protein [Psychrobacter sp.]MDN5619224.1 hypothetical protein [Psychrobacter sp.]
MLTFFKNIINAIRRFFGGKEEQKEVDVPQGLQVWDENGKLTLDTNDRVMKILGSLWCRSNSKLEDVDYHGGLEEGEFFWFFNWDASAKTGHGRVSVVRDYYINNQGNPIPRVTMRLADSHNNNTDSYHIVYGVY